MVICSGKRLWVPVVTLSPVMCTTGHWLSYVAHMPWAMRSLCCNTLVPAYVANVMLLLHAQALQVWDGVDNCPGTCPFINATFAHMLCALQASRVAAA